MPDARVVKEHRKVRIQYDLEDIVKNLDDLPLSARSKLF